MDTTVSVKVSQDLVDRIEELREEGESRSATVRRLLRAGLECEETGSVHVPYHVFASAAGWLFVAAAFLDAPQWIGLVGLVVVAVPFAALAVR